MALFKSWDSYLSTKETNDLLTEIAWKHLDTVQEIDRNDQWSLVRDMLRARDYSGLSQLELNVRALSADACAHLSQVLAFWKKRQDLDLGVDRKAVAYAKFEASELACASTNSLFRRWKSGDFIFPPTVERVLHAAQRKISHVLGVCPELEQFKVRFGPGSTTQVQKRKACSKVKLSQRPACSEDLQPLLVRLLEMVPAYVFPHESELALSRHLNNGDFLGVEVEDYLDERLPADWREHNSFQVYKEILRVEQARLRSTADLPDAPESVLVEVELHNGKLDFVPKNAKTDRSIVVEPWLNSIYSWGLAITWPSG